MISVRLRIAAAGAALALLACSGKEAATTVLNDTLLFTPGTAVSFKGQPAKLYGSSTCHVGGLLGQTCFLLTPTQPSATATIVSQGQVQEVRLTALRDPKNPANFVIQDAQGNRLLSTSGEENLLEFMHIGL